MEERIFWKACDLLPDVAAWWRNSQRLFASRKSRFTLLAIQTLKVLPQPWLLPRLLQ